MKKQREVNLIKRGREVLKKATFKKKFKNCRNNYN